ncbi:hypothetical protein [Nocardioides ungokensis]|uniref:hypothetical protein n=1 Tax=Nocardioides ungokensis TaxID=1643322 RepID=UPI0015DF6048|nr:hypothetical protein [Nocardioides ungokensis]
MSKMDDLRAMREARFEQMSARASKPTAPPKPRSPAPKPAEAEPGTDATEVPEASLCGHRAISGRTCTREQGHAAKSHRYS